MPLRGVTLGLVSALAFAGTAAAADLVEPAPAPAPAATGFGWSGLYVGIGGGAGAVVHDLGSAALGPSIGLDGIGGEGVFGEATVGYDYMATNRLLLGVFADGRFGNIETKLNASGAGFDAHVRNDYGFDVAARIGYLVTPSSLVYALGGYSWQHFDLGTSPSIYSYDTGLNGFIVGVGLETALSTNWTLKTEYRYAQYESDDFGSGGLLSDKPSMHTFHVGLNYHFNGAAAPVAFEAPVHSWNGFYVGGSVGAGALVHKVDVPPLAGASLNGIGGEGVFGEATIGYDYEFANGFVAGILADGRVSGIKTDGSIGGLGSASIKGDYGFDVLGRVGYKVDNSTLVYALGGWSWQHFKLDVNPSVVSYDWNANGFSVGGGLETALTDRATVGIEYRYSQYESEDFGSGGLLKVEPSSHTVRLGLKYKLF